MAHSWLPAAEGTAPAISDPCPAAEAAGGARAHRAPRPSGDVRAMLGLAPDPEPSEPPAPRPRPQLQREVADVGVGESATSIEALVAELDATQPMRQILHDVAEHLCADTCRARPSSALPDDRSDEWPLPSNGATTGGPRARRHRARVARPGLDSV